MQLDRDLRQPELSAISLLEAPDAKATSTCCSRGVRCDDSVSGVLSAGSRPAAGACSTSVGR